MNFVSIDCPYCKAANTSVEVSDFRLAQRPKFGAKPHETTHEAVGKCLGCHSTIALFFRVSNKRGHPLHDHTSLPKSIGILNAAELDGYGKRIFLCGYLPTPPKPTYPRELPDNVKRSFIEAEKSFASGGWTAAVMLYGKAVERGITPLIQTDKTRLTLGQKLGLLKDQGDLPRALQDWIKVVLDDRNYAVHDEDRDFTEENEVKPIREFARILLTYLYTMPSQVWTAQKATAERKNKP